MKELSQRNPEWASSTIGKTRLTIGRYGCTITCLSMLSSKWGKFKTPDVLAKELRFTKDGLLYWDSVDKALGFNFIQRGYTTPPSHISAPLLLEVDKYHWVLGVGIKTGTSRVWNIMDPWFGDTSTSLRYQKITGYALFSPKKHVPEEDDVGDGSWIRSLAKILKFPSWLGGKKT